jgi:hypothetical protein
MQAARSKKRAALTAPCKTLPRIIISLFNANEILRQKQESYATIFIDLYRMLSVYQDTVAQSGRVDKELEAPLPKPIVLLILKSKAIIWRCLPGFGQSQFFGTVNYFDAVEYFSYVITIIPKATQTWYRRLGLERRVAIISKYHKPEAKLA